MIVTTPQPFGRHPGLGDFTSDIVSTLGPLVGEAKVRTFMRGLETKIRTEAEAGARKAIPDITAEVKVAAKSAVKPIVTAALVAGAAGAVLGGIAIWISWRK